MTKLRKLPNKKQQIPCVCYQRCAAKSTKDGQPGINVHIHCEYVGEVASALLRRLPEAVKRLIPDGVVSLVVIHDVGKVSPGFQKKYFSEILKNYCHDLSRYDNTSFITSHAEISEASLKSWFKNNNSGDPDLEKWGEVLGNHHGKRDIPRPDGIDP